jgi:hypothetical protein
MFISQFEESDKKKKGVIVPPQMGGEGRERRGSTELKD